MFTKEQEDTIKEFIQENGAQGVNSITRHLGTIPLSTVQKYMKAQKFFKQNESRKWDLPERVNADITSNTMSLMVDSVEKALEVVISQIDDLKQSVEYVQMPLNPLRRAASVAKVSESTDQPSNKIHPLWDEAIKRLKDMPKIIKERKDSIPEEYTDLFFNLDWYAYSIKEGFNTINEHFSNYYAPLLIGEIEELPTELIEMLEKYQNGAEETKPKSS